jgi:hypothetical protein
MNDRIVFTKPDGSCGVITPTGEAPIDAVMIKDVPSDAINPRQITIAELPQDRLFRSAWDDSNPEDFIGLNLAKAKLMAHEWRREKRAEDFAPYDEIIAKQIPGQDAVAAENARQAIRDADAVTQNNIDNAVDEAELRAELIAKGII